MFAASSFAILVVLLDFGSAISSSSSTIIERKVDPIVGFLGSLQFILSFFAPSIAMLSMPPSDTNKLCLAYCVGSSIQNLLFVNGLLTHLSSHSSGGGANFFSVAWTVPASVSFAISSVSNTACDLQDLYVRDPNGPLPLITAVFSFPAYFITLVPIYYLYYHLKPIVCSHFSASAAATDMEGRVLAWNQLPLHVVQNLMYIGISLSLFLTLVIINAVDTHTNNSSNRGANLWIIRSFFILNICWVVLLSIVPWKITSMLKFKRVANENRTLENNDKLRSSLVFMLSHMVPKHVFQQISEGKATQPELHEFVVVFFCDIQGFTSFSASRGPFEVFDLITRLFSAIDTCCSRFDGEIYKVETVGDSYLAVGGLNKEVQSEQEKAALTETMARFAMAVRDAARAVTMGDDGFVKLRIGLHAGSIVTGLTGGLSPRYCVFGDTINTASRMETTGEAGRIHCSEDFARNLVVNRIRHGIGIAARKDTVRAKGKGLLRTFWIDDGHHKSNIDAIDIGIELGIPLGADSYNSDEEESDAETEGAVFTSSSSTIFLSGQYSRFGSADSLL